MASSAFTRKPPPRQLSKQVLTNISRALEFASSIKNLMGMVEDLEQQAARKASELFPTEEIPKQYTANV